MDTQARAEASEETFADEATQRDFDLDTVKGVLEIARRELAGLKLAYYGAKAGIEAFGVVADRRGEVVLARRWIDVLRKIAGALEEGTDAIPEPYDGPPKR